MTKPIEPEIMQDDNKPSKGGKSKVSKAMVKKEEPAQEALIPMPTMNIERLVDKALESNSSMETIERLVAISEKMREQWAKQQFIRALAKFQGECGAIVRSKPVFRKGATPELQAAYWEKGDMRGVTYLYSPLEDIFRQAVPTLSNNGISHTLKVEIDVEKKQLKAICELHHVDGHTEKTDFTVPIGSEYMSKQQEFGAANSFAKRYAFLNATGLQPEGEDNDAVNDDKGRKGGGGKDHRFKQEEKEVKMPTSKSEQKADPKNEEQQGTLQNKVWPDIKKAEAHNDRCQTSNINTLKSTMARLKIPLDSFKTAFGFPLDEVSRGSLNSVLAWMKEQE